MAKSNYETIMQIGDDCKFAKEGIVNTFHHMFPELKKSKDEEIRQFLIHEIEETSDEIMSYRNMNKKDVLAYLEKQGSLKDIVDRHKDSWYNEGKIAGMAEGLTDDEKYQQGWHDALEKQDEQKHVDEITSNPNYVGPKDKALFKIATVLSQHEDKDSSPLEEIRSILVDYGINNLESNEKNPAKWSEEDEKMFNDICTGIMEYIPKSFEENSKKVNWLKSICSKFHWKPSDEQMKFLWKYAEQNNYDGSILTSLYNDLEKLME
ncbi:hypothetical protein [Sharpea azabuensis]|uniref:hypothetical protein n=1 Tax=Sharpea azabuensis TaxID=322505 RepID=UPI001569C115|nr:hypothetical protein [Sharpea azabuensis]